MLLVGWTVFLPPGRGEAGTAARDEGWREDLQVLDQSIRETHPDPFRYVAEADYEAQVHRIAEAIPTLEDYEMVVELAGLTASLRDGHSAVLLEEADGFDRQYPVLIYPFDDGVYLSGAEDSYARYVGGKVVRIGSFPVEETLERIRTVINGENDYTLLDRIPRFLTYPLVLYALGISSDPDRLELTVEMADGARETFTVTPVPASAFEFLGPEVRSQGAVRARSAGASPRHLKNLGRNFWFEYLPKEELVYVQVNRMRNAPEERFAAFCRRLFTFVDSHPVDALVLDIRFNHGGNNQLLEPLIHGCIRRTDTFNRPGHFYTIVGRGTFSAAISCTAWLEDHTDVFFVGEPTGSGPIHFGDAKTIQLPHSGVRVRISAWEWQTLLPWDDRQWFAPRLSAPPTFAMYLEGRDPALEAILGDRAEPSLEVTILDAWNEGGIGKIEPAYRSYRERHSDRDSTAEAGMNGAGYRLLLDGNQEAALEVFRLNVESHPGSANCYDSLAEAHLMGGDREGAIQLYRRALEVDPEFANAARMLERIEHPEAAEGHAAGRAH